MQFHIDLSICPFGSNIPQLTYLHIYTQSMFVDLFTFRLQEAMSAFLSPSTSLVSKYGNKQPYLMLKKGNKQPYFTMLGTFLHFSTIKQPWSSNLGSF